MNAIDPSLVLERRARRRVGLKIGFATHALVYASVNLGLFLLAAANGHAWRSAPLWGWGIGLAIHGIVVFANLHGEGLRGRMVERETERLRRLG